jgi:hypothetical protein
VRVNQTQGGRGLLAVVVGLGLAASLLLTGCSAPAPGSGSGGTGGSGQSGQSDGTEDTTTSPGDVDLGDFEGLPETFPTNEIPIVAGDIPIGVDLGTGWSLIVEVDDTEAAYTEAAQKLKNAGFEAIAEQSSPEGSFGAFQNDKYQVQVTSTDSPDYGPSVNYVVVVNG